MPSAPGSVLAGIARDPARPRLTWYDDATGERVELSGATLLTWVAKTAHLLRDELGAGPGTRVDVDLPLHWTAAVCWLAIDVVGAELVPGSPGDGPVDVAVVGPGGLDPLPDADEVLAVSLRPMGAPFAEALPPLVRDFAAEVRSQPDTYPFDRHGSPADARAARQAVSWGLAPTDRVLVYEPVPSSDSPVILLTAALAADASVVWVRNPSQPLDVRLLVAEQVTAVVGALDLPGAQAIRSLPPTSVS